MMAKMIKKKKKLENKMGNKAMKIKLTNMLRGKGGKGKKE